MLPTRSPKDAPENRPWVISTAFSPQSMPWVAGGVYSEPDLHALTGRGIGVILGIVSEIAILVEKWHRWVPN